MIFVEVKTKGPVFDGRGKAQAKQCVEDIVKELGEKTKEMVQSYLDGVLRHPTGHYRGSITSEPQGDTAIVHGDLVIYGAWLEGVGSRNGASRFKGYHTFRTVAQQVRARAADLAQPIVARFVAKIS